MRSSLALILILPLALWSANPVWAQAPTTPPLTAFQTLFPHPTGNNGYEELVMAGDLLQNNPALDAATATQATLAAKRHALADPAVRKALELLKQGLDKPIVSPHPKSGTNARYPELGEL